MRNFQRKPRAFRPNRFFEERARLRLEALSIESERLSKVESLKTNPLEFFRQVLGVEPTDYQKELIDLFYKNQFTAARWSRQNDKTTQPQAYCSTMGWLIQISTSAWWILPGAKQNLLSDASGILHADYCIFQRFKA